MSCIPRNVTGKPLPHTEKLELEFPWLQEKLLKQPLKIPGQEDSRVTWEFLCIPKLLEIPSWTHRE